MKITELRIENYIHDYYNQDVIVSIDVLVRVQKCYDKREKFQDIYSPIPLTEDWLKKFGFKQMRESEYTFDTYELNDVKLWQKTNYEFFFEYSHIEIKYVHSLQNLYFALTEKELTFK